MLYLYIDFSKFILIKSLYFIEYIIIIIIYVEYLLIDIINSNTTLCENQIYTISIKNMIKNPGLNKTRNNTTNYEELRVVVQKILSRNIL